MPNKVFTIRCYEDIVIQVASEYGGSETNQLRQVEEKLTEIVQGMMAIKEPVIDVITYQLRNVAFGDN
jgi:hypothetical protein